MIALHNLLDPVKPAAFGEFGWLWDVLHVSTNFEYTRGFVFLSLYPLVPWIGVMASGYGFGRILQLDTARRRRTRANPPA